ncbi:MAG TPA: hypothetical protein VGO71_20185, partial [Baekduia sp.]|nr:hypothetical protein [Baekduia sp.]
MNRIEVSNQSVEAVPLHAPSSRLPATGLTTVPPLVWRREAPGFPRFLQSPALRPLLDLLGLSGALLLALHWPGEPVPLSEGWPLLLFPPLVMLLLLVRGMYEQRLRPTVLDGVVPIAGSISVAAMGVVAVEVYVAQAPIVPAVTAHLWACA